MSHDWWCENCQTIVQPDHVTFAETHDTRAQGCGYKVSLRDVTHMNLRKRINTLETENKALREHVTTDNSKVIRRLETECDTLQARIKELEAQTATWEAWYDNHAWAESLPPRPRKPLSQPPSKGLFTINATEYTGLKEGDVVRVSGEDFDRVFTGDTLLPFNT